MADIFERLEQDHQEMATMMVQISEQFDDAVFKRLASELQGHTKAEEEVLYDAVVDIEPAHELVLEGYEEHHVVDLVLRELIKNEHGTERWMAKFKVLKENVEHHVQEEEGHMFDALRPNVPPDKAIGMVSKFETAKKSHSS